MRILIAGTVLTGLLFGPQFPSCHAQLGNVELNAPVQVLASGEPIDVKRSGHSAPFFGDIDGDGLKDLIVGEYFEGRVRVFKNRGTAQQPAFTSYKWIKTETGNAKVPSD